MSPVFNPLSEMIEQNYAKKVKAGMWAGEFQEPEVWRRENRD